MSNEPRWNLIRRLRKQIAEGTYITEDKLRVAADRIHREVSSSPHTGRQMVDRKTRPDLDL